MTGEGNDQGGQPGVPLGGHGLRSTRGRSGPWRRWRRPSIQAQLASCLHPGAVLKRHSPRPAGHDIIDILATPATFQWASIPRSQMENEIKLWPGKPTIFERDVWEHSIL